MSHIGQHIPYTPAEVAGAQALKLHYDSTDDAEDFLCCSRVVLDAARIFDSREDPEKASE
jgi:hypothetical protein